MKGFIRKTLQLDEPALLKLLSLNEPKVKILGVSFDSDQELFTVKVARRQENAMRQPPEQR